VSGRRTSSLARIAALLFAAERALLAGLRNDAALDREAFALADRSDAAARDVVRLLRQGELPVAASAA
jgi:hypothetical protein